MRTQIESPAAQFAAAIRCENEEQGLPLWELEFHGWHLFSEKSFIVGEEFGRLGAGEQEKALHRNAEIITEVAHKLDFSAVTVPGGYWEQAPGHPAYFWLPETARYKQIRILEKMLCGKVMMVASCPAVLAMPGADEYMDFAYTLMERPEEIESRARILYDSGCELASRLLDLGVGALYTASDIADNHGPYFDPEQMKRLILPFLDGWSAHVQGKGGLSILHSDGKLDAILDPIADTGIQALQAIDPTAGMDLAATMDAVRGRLCLCGNINCSLFIAGTPGQVYENTQLTLESIRGKGHLVLGASNAIEKEMKKENYEAYLRARYEYRVPRTEN